MAAIDLWLPSDSSWLYRNGHSWVHYNGF